MASRTGSEIKATACENRRRMGRPFLRLIFLTGLLAATIRFLFFPGPPEALEHWWGLSTLAKANASTNARLEIADKSITYSKDVAPILRKRCVCCHRPGEVGPFSLLTYRDASKRASFLAEVVDRREMPPSKAEPGFGDFVDEPRLTDREIAVIDRWAESGAPEGEQLPESPPSMRSSREWKLGTPDAILEMPASFAVQAGGEDRYRAFVLPLKIDRDREIVAFEFQPGNRRVVHHAKIFLDLTEESSRRDAEDPLAGFESIGLVDLVGPALFEWTPGTIPWTPPPGVGQVLKAKGHLVLFIHYHPAGKTEVDRSRVGVYFAKRPLRARLAGVPLGTSRIDIPPGVKSHQATASTVLPADVRVFGLLPHGHFLLRELRLRAVKPDGTIERLLWIKDWDFNWQGRYQLRNPLFLPRGTRIDLVGIYDNSSENPRNPSSPPRRVRFGPSSLDEMLGCHLQVIPEKSAGSIALRRRYPAGF